MVFLSKNLTFKKMQELAMEVLKCGGTGRKIPHGGVPYFCKKHANAGTHDSMGDEVVAATNYPVRMDTRIYIYGLDTLSRSGQEN